MTRFLLIFIVSLASSSCYGNEFGRVENSYMSVVRILNWAVESQIENCQNYDVAVAISTTGLNLGGIFFRDININKIQDQLHPMLVDRKFLLDNLPEEYIFNCRKGINVDHTKKVYESPHRQLITLKKLWEEPECARKIKSYITEAYYTLKERKSIYFDVYLVPNLGMRVSANGQSHYKKLICREGLQ